ncbi:hypothetical protein [Aquabacterium sp. OR-4]|uniref:hypothetical protein n=1 Tax=Aquabacterium sp. OR-4 TaxID=2978127 RepID=UPI0021B3D1F0|nr:hypothetical protein [Aquabacterium sp. OR-4]MDT7835844.1 hypothetical protein [Aquabacterium sp. OR-4]
MNQAKAGPRALTTLAALLLAAFAGSAGAETSPWYLGASQSFTHDSNLLRRNGAADVPAGYSMADTIASSALLGGLDQRWGRQQLNASATVRANRFQNNSVYNNTSYSLNGTLAWETVNRLSGTLKLASSQNLASFADSNAQAVRNVERANQIDALARLGSSTRATLEAGLGWKSRDYSAAAYDVYELRQTYGSLGVKWRSSDLLQLGAALRLTQGRYPHFPSATVSGAYDPDAFRRQDIDFTALWKPSGASSLSARISPTRTRYDRETSRDFSSLTGQMRWDWAATGKLRVNSRLWRDNGQSADVSGLTLIDSGRTSNSLSMGADYAFSAKLGFNASIEHTRRELTRTRSIPALGINDGGLSVDDRTTSLALGARWSPLRAMMLGCDLGREQRSGPANTGLTRPYSANTVSCYGQFTLQ